MKSMRSFAEASVCLAAVLAATPTARAAAPPAKTIYAAALSREHDVRTAMDEHDSDRRDDVLHEVRAVIAAYEAVVRRYPTSGYSDNALWQAGCLALDAFDKFGAASDQEVGVRLLRSLATRYPSSRLARRVREILDARPVGSAGRTSASAVAARPPAMIRNITRTVLPDAVRVTIELDNEVAFHEERIANPERVFLDLAATRPASTLSDRTLRFERDNDIVRQVRIGRHPNNTTRVVLDAAGIASYTVYALYNPPRLVIDCARANARGFQVPRSGFQVLPEPGTRNPEPGTRNVEPGTSVAPRNLPSRRIESDWARRLPLRHARMTDLLAAAREVAAPPRTVEERSVPPSPGVSMARQLGLSVSRIVIDPGHGGHDPGAKGKGLTEAELVLDVALRLEKLLERLTGVEAILTRRTDEFVPLQERTAIANREGADLFLSIHANASPVPSARGIETYFLNFANTLSAAAVASRENAASGQAMSALPDFVKAIALNNKLDESKDFAAQVQRSMIERLRGANRPLKDLGVKQAPFVVLIGAAMPSVLAEISFVTNPQEAKLLRSSAYRQRIAEALLTAIRKYQTSLRTVNAVAHQ